MNILNLGYDSSNYYLIEPDGAGLLVDIGWPGTMPRFLGTLKRMGVPLNRIKYLLCTHYHPDHAGLAQELKENGIPLIVFESQLGALSALGRYMKPSQHFQPISLNGNITLAPSGSRKFLRSLGLNGEVIYTPGHSDDCVSLLLDQGLAFTGDALNPMQNAASQDLVESIWTVLRSHSITKLYPGHGPLREMR